jgi:hypothetical protein
MRRLRVLFWAAVPLVVVYLVVGYIASALFPSPNSAAAAITSNVVGVLAAIAYLLLWRRYYQRGGVGLLGPRDKTVVHATIRFFDERIADGWRPLEAFLGAVEVGEHMGISQRARFTISQYPPIHAVLLEHPADMGVREFLQDPILPALELPGS